MDIPRNVISSVLAICALFGTLSMSAQAGYSDRRQIIIFAAPEFRHNQRVQASVDILRCQLVERDTNVRFVDTSELPVAAANRSVLVTHNEGTVLSELAMFRSDDHPEFEMVLVGKDGGVKARTSDVNAIHDFIALIDSMPMRQAEMRIRGGSNACKSR